ncbi:MAG: glycosyltransferase [Chroococcidiopsidaceae cyanobacterium CP_BM_RX_35]|nr:glycosyltransferase [Chroococcidiopsidaceae cyanobacterium CP_BM_RX_35]
MIDDPTQISPATATLPFVSVIVPIYNGEGDLPDLVDCLQQQTYPAERTEYLLVDNNSGDRTASLLKTLVQTSHPMQICLLQESTIQSSYAARNVGIRAARGEFLAFTDADCRPQADWLRQLIQPFGKPTVGLVAGEILALPSTGWLERYAERYATLSQKHTLAHPFYPYGQTANLAVRRRVLEQVGLFRSYLITGGDADLCWRILQSGQWQLILAAQAIVQHRHRSTLNELRSQWRRYGQGNRYLHELHGVSLGKEMRWYDYCYRLSRWLLKEVPITVTQFNHRGIEVPSLLDDLLDTPLDLICGHARAVGQREALLPPLAYDIAWLVSEPVSEV